MSWIETLFNNIVFQTVIANASGSRGSELRNNEEIEKIRKSLGIEQL